MFDTDYITSALNGQTCGTPLTSAAYFETGSKTRDYTMSVHAGMLKIHRPQSPKITAPVPANKRGIIRGFSKAARKRMIEFMACVRQRGSLLFVTLTYPDVFPLESAAWHRHFEAFRDQFEENYPDARAIWRIETIDRKSGENAGAIAPHWHLIIFLPVMDDERLLIEAALMQTDLRERWYGIVNSGDEQHLLHGVDIRPVKSIKHAMMYVSKYVAKETNDLMTIGRRWGRIGRFNTSESVKVSLTYEEYLNFRRIVRAWMRKRSGRFHRRFARLSPYKGCAVFGMGDEAGAHYGAFLYEAFRQAFDDYERERGSNP